MFWVRRFVYTLLGFVALVGVIWFGSRSISSGPSAGDDQSGRPIGSAVGISNEPWQATNRDRLIICVDVLDVSPALRDAAKDQVANALMVIAQTPPSGQNWDLYWKDHWAETFGDGAWEVVVGCLPPIAWDGARLSEDIEGAGGWVDVPADYLVAVYVGKSDTLKQRRDRYSIEQTLRIGYDAGVGITTGLYISDSEICDTYRLSEALRDTIGPVEGQRYTFPPYEVPNFDSERLPTPTAPPSSPTLPC